MRVYFSARDGHESTLPYAYKLFLQELESMNISSRLIPDRLLNSFTETEEELIKNNFQMKV